MASRKAAIAAIEAAVDVVHLVAELITRVRRHGARERTRRRRRGGGFRDSRLGVRVSTQRTSRACEAVEVVRRGNDGPRRVEERRLLIQHGAGEHTHGEQHRGQESLHALLLYDGERDQSLLHEANRRRLEVEAREQQRLHRAIGGRQRERRRPHRAQRETFVRATERREIDADDGVPAAARRHYARHELLHTTTSEQHTVDVRMRAQEVDQRVLARPGARLHRLIRVRGGRLEVDEEDAHERGRVGRRRYPHGSGRVEARRESVSGAVAPRLEGRVRNRGHDAHDAHGAVPRRLLTGDDARRVFILTDVTEYAQRGEVARAGVR